MISPGDFNVIFRNFLTFSVMVTLLRRSVENPDEQSVSAEGELGHDRVSPSPPPPSAPLTAPEKTIIQMSSQGYQDLRTFRPKLKKS